MSNKTQFLLILSGEGPTDLGQNIPTSAGSKTFSPGPMALFVRRLIEAERPATNTTNIVYFSEKDLSSEIKLQNTSKGKMKIIGKKRRCGPLLFYNNALALGLAAEKTAKASNMPYIAVLFRDNDGSRTTNNILARQEKITSMAEGFTAAGCNTGIPMIPQPKSEAWLLCALSKNYQHCDKLETRSGNDSSPDSLKKELSLILKKSPVNAETLNGLIDQGTIEPLKISMPSFNEFKATLSEKLRKVFPAS